MRLSIVTTMYRSAPYLAEFHARAEAAVRRLGHEPEFVYVNDGSPDDALDRALALREAHGHVRVVDLSRNFGHHPAMMTGLAHATGERVFLIDCDLEEAPELLERFAARMDQTGADVIYGVQTRRQEGWFHRLMARGYYRVLTWLSQMSISENLMTVRLMTRRYVDALLSHREVEFVIAGLWSRTGFEQLPEPVDKKRKPSSTYTLGRKVGMVLRTVTAISPRLLYVVFVLGLLISGVSALAALALVIIRICLPGMLPGWASLMVSVWFLGGLSIFCQGVIGIYLARIYVEVKHRPLSIVRHVHQPTRGSSREQLPRAG